VTWFSSLCSRRITPIGIDVGGFTIKAAQLVRTRQGYELAAAAVLPLAIPNMELDLAATLRVREALLEQGFRGANIVVGVPNDKLETNLLDIPRGTVAPIGTLISAELHRSHDLPTGSFELAHWKLPSVVQAEPGETSVMAVAARNADLETLMDLFEDVGFHVEAMDTQSWALARACSPITSRPGKSIHAGEPLSAIVDLGFNAALLVLVHNGVVLHQHRVTSAGGNRLRTAVLDRFGLSGEVADGLLKDTSLDLTHGSTSGESVHAAWTRNLLVRHADTLAVEIKRCVNEVTQRRPALRLARLVLCGGGAQMMGLEGYLSARFGVDVIPARPRELVRAHAPSADIAHRLPSAASPRTEDPRPASANNNPALAGAIGLAQWGE
jgi:type IV pilus assembly protein PilM